MKYEGKLFVFGAQLKYFKSNMLKMSVSF